MSKQAIRFYVQTRTILGFNPTEIHEELTDAHGDDVASYSTVLRWSNKTDDGEMEIEDQPRSGRPVTGPTEANIEKVRRVIDEDPHSTYDEIEEETSLSRGTIQTIIHDHLKLKKITSRWVPYDLTPQQKEDRVRMCKENLERFRNGSGRLCDIITGDETWIYLRQVGRKQSNASWLREGQSPGTAVKRNRYEPKVLFSIFFKSNGFVIIHAVGKGQTIDRFYYIDQLLKRVIKEVKKQRPNSGLKNMKLLHDNSPVHDHQDVLDYLKLEGLTPLPHPPYSPDLAPCDYWLNDYIKRNLTDQKDEKSLIKAVTKIVMEIPKDEYKKTFEKLLDRMELCINNKGEYFEHLMK